VLGPEAPLIALGSVVGMVVALSGAFGQREQTVLATAGSFSAISALFGGPIVGGMMMVESGVAMGSALLPVVIPGFVAAIGYVTFVGFGTWGGLHAQSLAVPGLPPYNGTARLRPRHRARRAHPCVVRRLPDPRRRRGRRRGDGRRHAPPHHLDAVRSCSSAPPGWMPFPPPCSPPAPPG
jgi:hypothetical protein